MAESASPSPGEKATTRLRRRRSDLVWLAGSAVSAVTASLAIDGNVVSDPEEIVFRIANDVPGALFPVLWPLMQFGTFISVPATAIIALAFRRVRLAAELSAAGTSAYFLAKVVKDLYPRDRPGAILAEVHLRGIGIGGRGYPSGHAAVSASLAFVLWPYLPRRWRWVPVALAGVVSFGRMYVGGHLPLDVLGGAALGIACGAAVTFVGKVPSPAETELVAPGGPNPTQGV